MFQLAELLFRNCFFLYRPLYFLYKHVSEKKQIKLFRMLIDKGDVVVDAGANIGFYSRIFSSCVGADGKVLAFEPEPENFNHLKNLSYPCNNVDFLPYAVSNEEKETFFYCSDRYNVDHRLYPDTHNQKKISVKTVTLSRFINSQKPHFIKSDIQGYDFYALLGMENEFKTLRDLAVFVEFWSYGLRKAGVQPEDMYNFFLQKEGKLFWFKGKKLHLLPCDDFFVHANTENPDEYSDLLFVKGKYAEKIQDYIRTG